MKKKVIISICALFSVLFGIAIFTACSSDESESVAKQGEAEITFAFDAKTVTKALSNDVGNCDATLSDEGLKVEIGYKKDGAEVTPKLTLDLKKYNGVYKTEPQEFGAGTYVITSAIVYQGESIIYSGVLYNESSPAPYAQFIPENELMGKKTFTIGNGENELHFYTKPTIDIYVLCARHETASNFGMPKFQLNFTEVTCLNVFVNVCNPDADDEHEVGIGTMKLFSEDGKTLLSTATFRDGFIGTLCFPDNLSTSNDTEKYKLELTLTNDFLSGNVVLTGIVTVEQLLDYVNSEAWDGSKKLLHIIYCGEEKICYESTKEDTKYDWCLTKETKSNN